jgi:hypothetical protein
MPGSAGAKKRRNRRARAIDAPPVARLGLRRGPQFLLGVFDRGGEPALERGPDFDPVPLWPPGGAQGTGPPRACIAMNARLAGVDGWRDRLPVRRLDDLGWSNNEHSRELARLDVIRVVPLDSDSGLSQVVGYARLSLYSALQVRPHHEQVDG